MKSVWKFGLDITDEQIIEMPVKAEILSAQYQNGYLYIWALVNPEAEKEKRIIAIQGTGNPFPYTNDQHVFIATVQQPPFVWHIFETFKYKK